ncbi:protein phosphatase 2C domain-containing protein [Oryzomicrobium sp.]|uniref:PP2C family protein-serine/threonine phosphatase n=1 Tax=Oryzomicrobium sp. TaxID=1911578 RepID=UPI0025D930CF|nr:protein phosphatase 2C domain-containing protein [Oryzomicrobium sp.]MCE1244461.1 protein phosphatase 2C domain-containing protein [Oryzomicrobium sp.]
MPLQLDVCVSQHIGDRHEQQDRVALVPHPRLRGVVLAVVADGMGGHEGGALAAEQVVHTARQCLEGYAPSEETPEELLRTILDEAHTLIRAGRFINEKDPHSTGVLLLLEPTRATWAHCGDSRLYWFSGSELRQRTDDHSYVGRLVRDGTISEEEASFHPNRNVLLTALGGREAPMVDVGSCESLAAGDAFLICSDGLWGYFGEAEMGGIIAAQSARDAAGELMRRARSRGRGEGDNLSLALVRLEEMPAVKPVPPPVRRPLGNAPVTPA